MLERLRKLTSEGPTLTDLDELTSRRYDDICWPLRAVFRSPADIEACCLAVRPVYTVMHTTKLNSDDDGNDVTQGE